MEARKLLFLIPAMPSILYPTYNLFYFPKYHCLQDTITFLLDDHNGLQSSFHTSGPSCYILHRKRLWSFFQESLILSSSTLSIFLHLPVSAMASPSSSVSMLILWLLWCVMPFLAWSLLTLFLLPGLSSPCSLCCLLLPWLPHSSFKSQFSGFSWLDQ